MSKTPTLFDQNEAQAQAAKGAIETMGTATNDAQDPIGEGPRDATATHNAEDPAVEESSNESDEEWTPGQPFEDLLYRIPLDEARVMTRAGHTVQQSRNQF